MGKFRSATCKAFCKESKYLHLCPSVHAIVVALLEGALYFQDTIRIAPSFELRVGLRGELTSGWDEANGRASNYLFDSSGTIFSQPSVGGSAFTENHARFLPAPRIGFAWSPLGNTKRLSAADSVCTTHCSII